MIILFVMMCTLNIVSITAQVAPKSVMGCTFGESREDVYKTLCERFGEFNVFDKNGPIKLYDIEIGGIYWHIVSFSFQYDNSNSYLYSIEFQYHTEVSDTQRAIDKREVVRYELEKKYTLTPFNNEQKFKCYSISDGDDFVGYLWVDKGKSRGGDNFLYVTLTYEPYDFGLSDY